MKSYILFFILISCCLDSVIAQQEHQATKADAIDEFYKKGEMMRKARQYDKALLEYDYALAINDTISRVYMAKGIVYYAQKNMLNAIEALEKTVTLDPKNLNAFNLLVKMYKQAQNSDKVVFTLERMAEAHEKPEEQQTAFLRVASLYIKTKKFEKAKVYTDKALEIDKSNLEALFHHAQVSNALGNYEEAKRSMETATATLTSVDPKISAKYYFELGYAYHHLKDYEKKEAAFSKAQYGRYKLLITKLTPDYFYNLGNSFAQIYDLSKADELLNEALKIDPSHPTTNKLLAEIAIKAENHPKKAIDYFKKAIEGEKDSKKAVRLYDTAIELLLSSEKYDEAIQLADECLSKALNARNILLMKSMALHKKDNTKEALVILEKLILDANLTPLEIVKYNFAAGVMFRAEKDFAKAKDAFNKSSKGPFSTVAQYEFEMMNQQTLVAE